MGQPPKGHTYTSAIDKLAFMPNISIYTLTLVTSITTTFTVNAFIFRKVGASTAIYITIAVFCAAIIVLHCIARRKVTRTFIPRLRWLVQANFGKPLTAVLSGTDRISDVDKWLNRSKMPSKRQHARIVFVFETFALLSNSKDPEELTRLLTSPTIGYERTSPAEAIRADRFDEVTAFVLQVINKGHTVYS